MDLSDGRAEPVWQSRLRAALRQQFPDSRDGAEWLGLIVFIDATEIRVRVLTRELLNATGSSCGATLSPRILSRPRNSLRLWLARYRLGSQRRRVAESMTLSDAGVAT